jgi:DNA-binding HxlR family transcriptional regulator
MHEQCEVRYTTLSQIFSSRTLSLNLKILEKEKLIERRVEPSKPIKAFYFLTLKGKNVALRFREINHIQRE